MVIAGGGALFADPDLQVQALVEALGDRSPRR